MTYDRNSEQNPNIYTTPPSGEQIRHALGNMAVSSQANTKNSESDQSDTHLTSGYAIKTIRVMGVGFAPKKTNPDSYGLIALANQRRQEQIKKEIALLQAEHDHLDG